MFVGMEPGFVGSSDSWSEEPLFLSIYDIPFCLLYLQNLILKSYCFWLFHLPMRPFRHAFKSVRHAKKCSKKCHLDAVKASRLFKNEKVGKFSLVFFESKRGR